MEVWSHTSSYIALPVREMITVGVSRSAYRVLVGKPEGRRPLGRQRLRWEDNINMGLRELGWGVWTASRLLRIGTGGGLL